MSLGQAGHTDLEQVLVFVQGVGVVTTRGVLDFTQVDLLWGWIGQDGYSLIELCA